MSFVKTAFLASALATSLAGSVFAQGTGSEGYFQIYNDSNNALVGFYTDDGSGLSQNWIGGIVIQPNENATAEFTADTGSCDQLIVTSWAGEGGGEVFDEPISIDICAASNVYLGDNEISFD